MTKEIKERRKRRSARKGPRSRLVEGTEIKRIDVTFGPGGVVVYIDGRRSRRVKAEGLVQVYRRRERRKS